MNAIIQQERNMLKKFASTS